jgi:hypothetical protein
MNFKIADGIISVAHRNKNYIGYIAEDLFQCKEAHEFLRRPRSIPMIASLVLKKTDSFETQIEEKNDIPMDIHGAGPSTPREHLKIHFVMKRNHEKVPVYFNLIHYE